MQHARKSRDLGLVLIGLLVGMLLISPASAHFRESTRHLGKHVWGQVIKSQADKRYLRSRVRRVEVISDDTSADNQTRNVTASCPSGERAIGGGGMWTTTGGDPTGAHILQGSRPVPSGSGTGVTTGWQATGITNSIAVRQLRAYALCVPIG